MSVGNSKPTILKLRNEAKETIVSAETSEDEFRKEEYEKIKNVLITTHKVSAESYYDFPRDMILRLDTTAKLSTNFWNALSLGANHILKEARIISAYLSYQFKIRSSAIESKIVQAKGDHVPY